MSLYLTFVQIKESISFKVFFNQFNEYLFLQLQCGPRHNLSSNSEQRWHQLLSWGFSFHFLTLRVCRSIPLLNRKANCQNSVFCHMYKHCRSILQNKTAVCYLNPVCWSSFHMFVSFSPGKLMFQGLGSSLPISYNGLQLQAHKLHFQALISSNNSKEQDNLNFPTNASLRSESQSLPFFYFQGIKSRL